VLQVILVVSVSVFEFMANLEIVKLNTREVADPGILEGWGQIELIKIFGHFGCRI
jgi:hypothetical protein